MAWPFTPPASWRRTGPDEWHGPCPVTNEGRDAAWVQPGAENAGCRKCGGASGRLDNDQFRAHLTALGINRVDFGSVDRGTKLHTWIWSTADGRTREQHRWSSGGKTWEPTEPKNDPPPKSLLYVPRAFEQMPGLIVLCEGASSTDNLLKIGLDAVGRPAARPIEASVKRIAQWAANARDGRVLSWPDHDPAGYDQAYWFVAALRRLGVTVHWLDPLRIDPNVVTPVKWDPGDWDGSPPPQLDRHPDEIKL